MEITAVLADIGDLNSHTLTINYEEVSLVFSRTIDELVDPVNTGETAFRGTKATVLYTTPVFLAGEFWKERIDCYIQINLSSEPNHTLHHG